MPPQAVSALEEEPSDAGLVMGQEQDGKKKLRSVCVLDFFVCDFSVKRAVIKKTGSLFVLKRFRIGKDV